MDFKSKLRHVMDFPKKGIDFIDITTVLNDNVAYKECLDAMAEKAKEFGKIDVIMAAESRGFIFGAPLAYILGAGFVPVRKTGKLPYKTLRAEYKLEYGTSELEVHIDSMVEGQKALIVDDLLATGGTISAMVWLAEQMGVDIAGLLFFVELEELKGRKKFKDYKIESLVTL